MGWQDRPYSSKPSSNSPSFNFQNILFGSLSLGDWFGIHVRVHASLILLIAFRVLFSGGSGFVNALLTSAILFGVILLHEFGHCFAARHVGGDAREILLWPLGGLAFVSTPRRPWPSFFATAGGPLVNVVICLVTGTALLLLSGGQFQLPFNPLIPFGGGAFMGAQSHLFLGANSVAYYLWWIYITSWTLLFFNLLPIFPLDGGQLLQAALWPKFGYVRSMDFACTTGIAGAILVGLWGLYSGNLWLLFLAFAGFMTCYRTKMNLSDYSEPMVAGESRYNVSFSSPALKRKVVKKTSRKRPHDDRFTLRDLNPLERIAREKRKKQFERLMRDD